MPSPRRSSGTFPPHPFRFFGDCAIVSFVAKYSDELSEIFTALADPTRRAVVDRLGRGPATISELAEPLSISLPSFLKHVRTLEDCGLIRTRKSGRVRTCVLDERRLGIIDQWLDVQRRSWEAATDRLDAFVTADPQANSTAPPR